MGETASSAKFKIEPPLHELSQLAVDEWALRNAAKISGGKYYTLETVSKLAGDLPPPRQTAIEQLPARSLWNTHTAMALFIFLQPSGFCDAVMACCRMVSADGHVDREKKGIVHG